MGHVSLVPPATGLPENTVEARDSWGRIVAALLLVGLLLFTGLVGQGFFNGTDFGAWERDWGTFVGCLTDGGCDALTKFPVGYLINSGIVHSASAIAAPPLVLWTLNFALLLLPIAAGYLLRFPGATDRATVYALGFVLSPIPMYYLWSAALEFQAGILAGMLVVLAARCLRDEAGVRGTGERWLLATVSFLAPLYKDTAIVLLAAGAAAGLLALALFEGTARQAAARLRAGLAKLRWEVILPVVAAIVVQVGYNLLRYGSPLPVAYLIEAELAAPTYAVSGMFLLGSVLSPNGGIIAFWTLPFVVVLACLRVQGARLDRPAVAVAIGNAFLSLLAFSRWWAPFGWGAWGDRLMVPSMVCLFVVVVFSARMPEDLASATHATPAPRRSGSWALRGVAAFVLAAMTVLSVNYVAASYLMEDGMYRSLTQSGPKCERADRRMKKITDGTGGKSKAYYACVRERFLYVPTAWK